MPANITSPPVIGQPRKTSVQGEPFWFTVPQSWFCMPDPEGSNQVFASPNPDYSNPVYCCVLDDSGQNLAFQDLMAERYGYFPPRIPVISPLPFTITNGIYQITIKDSGRHVRWPMFDYIKGKTVYVRIKNGFPVFDYPNSTVNPYVNHINYWQTTDLGTNQTVYLRVGNGQFVITSGL